jgi:hypothetical protein
MLSIVSAINGSPVENKDGEPVRYVGSYKSYANDVHIFAVRRENGGNNWYEWAREYLDDGTLYKKEVSSFMNDYLVMSVAK